MAAPRTGRNTPSTPASSTRTWKTYRISLALLPVMALLIFSPFNSLPLELPVLFLLLPLLAVFTAGSEVLRALRWYRPHSFGDWPVLGLALWGASSLLWTVDRQQTQMAVLLLVMAVAVYFMIAHAYDRDEVHLLLGTLLVAGGAVLLAGVGELWRGDGVLPYLGGPFLYKNTFAIYLLCVGLLALGWAAQAGDYKWWALVALAGCALVLTVLTRSRGATYLVLPGLALLLLMAPQRRNLLRAMLAALVAGGLAVGGLVAVKVALQPDRAPAEMGATIQMYVLTGESDTVWARLSLWRAGLRMLADRPALGFGLDTYPEAGPAYQTDWRVYAQDAHNHYVQTVAELGVPGALLLLAVPLGVAWHGGRLALAGLKGTAAAPGPDASLRAGLAAAALALAAHALIDVDFQFPAVWLLFWIMVGADRALRRDDAAEAAGAALSAALVERLRPWRPRLVWLALMVAATFFAVRPYAADGLYQQALAVAEQGDWERAGALLNRAARWNGWNKQVRHLQAMVVLTRGEVDGDAAAIQRGLSLLQGAVANSPYDTELRFQLATQYVRFDRLSEAEEHLRTATERAPFNPHYRYALAAVLVRTQRLTEARAELAALLDNPAAYVVGVRDRARVDNTLRDARLLLAGILAGQGETAAAREHIEAILQREPEHAAARELQQRLPPE